MKARFDSVATRLKFLPRDLSDKIMQAVSGLFPGHLPKRMKDYRDKFEHHLMLKMSGSGIKEARTYLASVFPSDQGAFFESSPAEGEKAFLHQFAVAGAAVRYRAIHRDEVQDIVSLDIALRRNDRNWFEKLPPDISAPITHKLYYGHFFCHVFHQDYIVTKGHDTMALEHKMWKLLDARGARYPAEHNVGHLYEAEPSLIDHYKTSRSLQQLQSRDRPHLKVCSLALTICEKSFIGQNVDSLVVQFGPPTSSFKMNRVKVPTSGNIREGN